MRRVLQRLAACALSLSLCAGLPATAYAQPSVRGADDKVSLNFVDVDIAAVLRAMSLFTKRNYLYDPRVKGKMTLVSDQPVDRQTAMNMLAGSLRLQGYAIVEVGGVTRVVPEADAKLQGSAMSVEEFDRRGRGAAPGAAGAAGGVGSPRASGGEVVTRVFPLKYENAANLVPVLRPMVPPNNPVNAYPGNNTVVVTDYADNMERIARVIASIDVPTSIDTAVVPVRYAIASDVAALASQLLDAQQNSADASQRIAVVADPRTNNVVIRAGSPARTALARDLVVKLDTQQANAGNLHVVYLRNAQAVRLAAVLGGLLSGQASTAPGANGNGAAGAQGNRAAGQQGGQQNTGGGNMYTPTGMGGNGTTGTSSSGNAGLGSGQQQAIARVDGSNNMQPVSYSGNGATVQADPATNTLIISATEPQYRSLREVIDMLDQRRAQVLVESMIVEVTEDQAAQIGIQWFGATNGLGTNGASVIGGTNLGGSSINTSAATTIDALPSGLNIGLIRGTTTIPGIGQILNLNVLATALKTNGGANILSTPNLMTLDNEAASIMVGKTVPFVTGQYVTSGSGSSSNPFQTIEREDVGLKLNIRPQISEGGSVKLDIYQEVSSIDTASSTSTSGIVTNKRAIDTSVLIDDGQIIVLGGLLQDSVSTTNQGVPGLSSIPLLGALFRSDTRSREKTNLMVFLRPHVIRNSQDSMGVTLDRYNYMRRAQSAVQPGEHWALPGMTAPILPPANVRGVPTGAYDLRPAAAAETMRQAPPPVTQSYSVRQLPETPRPPDEVIRANVPIGVTIATDPSALYGETDTTKTTLQFALADAREQADSIAGRVRMSGLDAYSQPGPGGQGYVVRSQVPRDARSVDTALSLLKQLGYKPELVTQP
ncbi:type II secretion system secretin GspD [Achromobacter aloeverae]|uniref:Type II secretion system protein GspD n=1 Tax=Achromobacter aloeverae TaxID=1750518 RepID=A0A4Q1HDG2_9BURK|nr:type II secretion system secretin GspD [Achromobacter aloeverae]RXN83875.1 type II secretion system protein GspD [Achromobacter aloeverae]